MSTNTKIEIKPIDMKKWHGKKGEESFARPQKLQPLVDPSTRQYATGLNEKEIEEYGERLKADLSPHWDPEKPHPFWDSSIPVLKLENNTMILDIAQPINFIKYRVAKASKYVANSLKSYEEGKYPEATHYIVDEREEVEAKASKVALKNKAVQVSMSLSDERKSEIIMILEGKNVKGQSPSFIVTVLDEIIQKKPEEFLRYAEIEDKELVSNKALVKEALQKSVLTKEGHKIKWFDSVLGDSIDSVAEYLKDTENQELKLMLMEKINE